MCVQGCDASVILVSTGNNTAEKDHPSNLSLAGDGFDTVIQAKAAVDAVPACANQVSCADILALATRDAIVLVRSRRPSSPCPQPIKCRGSKLYCARIWWRGARKRPSFRGFPHAVSLPRKRKVTSCCRFRLAGRRTRWSSGGWTG